MPSSKGKKKTPVKKPTTKSLIVKAKIPKDPKAPKGALTAFMIFSTENRPKLPKNISFGESGKRLGKQWKAMPAAKRAKYEKLAEKDRERYRKEMSKYKPSKKMAEAIAAAKAKPAKVKADPNAPKRGRTSYIVFSDMHRPALAKKYKNMKMTEISKKLGEMWKKVSDKDKAKCEKTAKQERAAYEKAMAKYNPPKEYQAALDKVAAMKNKGSNADKAAKEKEKKKAAKMKEQLKKLKETEKKWIKEVKTAEAAFKKLSVQANKLGTAKSKLAEASKALKTFSKENGLAVAKPKGKKAPPRIAEAVAVDGPKKSIKKKTAAKKKATKKK